MRQIKLTKYEEEILVDLLFSHSLCNSDCYCNYKTNMCNKYDKDGNYRCKLQKAVQNIARKLDVEC